MSRLAVALALAFLLPLPLRAADPPDKSISKEPAYRTKSPQYGLLAFGHEAKNRAWLVFDGDTLYVDRNGNGDLTDAGEKIDAMKLVRPRDDSDGYQFEVGDLTLGGRTHKPLKVYAGPLTGYKDSPFGNTLIVKDTLARDPKTMVFTVTCDADVPGMKGGGTGGRLSYTVGPADLNGVLMFADKPTVAPVMHLGGPLRVTFYKKLPTMRVSRVRDFVLVVGTPGVGNGTFAMLAYENTIPKTAWPVAEVTYRPAKPGDPPVKEKYEIKERC